jgi:branched-chain amino acid transport system permease protein
MNPLQLAVDALSQGSQYALIALGIGIVFGIMRMVNFAHGEFITIGAYSLLVPSLGVVSKPLFGALPAPLLVLGVLGVVTATTLLTERFAFRPLRRRNADGASLLISSFAVGYLLQSVVLFLYSGRPRSVSIFPELTAQVEFAGVRTSIADVMTIVVAGSLLIALVLFMKRSRIGVEMRAASEDFTMARLLGVKADRVIAVAFLISGLLAAVVALLYVAKTGTTDFRMGTPLAIAGFVATVIGGMGNLSGAVFGGFFLGITSTMLQALLPASLRPARDAFVYGLVILVLLWRPQGLFTKKSSGERI